MNVVIGQIGLPGNRFATTREVEDRAHELEQQVAELSKELRPLDNREGVDRVTWDNRGGIVSVDLRHNCDVEVPAMKKSGYDVAEMSYEPTAPYVVSSLDASGNSALGHTRLSVVPGNASTRYFVDEGPYHYELTVSDSGSIFCEGFDDRQGPAQAKLRSGL